jgi:serine/threonine protein kinase
VELAPGTILLGKYRIEELIGTGGMGNVVRASHLYLQQPVAIKILLPQMVENESTVQRFLREAQAAVKLKSEHSARVMDVGTAPDGAPFMVMEFLDGNDLNQILRHHGPQVPPVVVDLMLQACEGIAEAHALGIIHRDIKPSNFFITRRPDGSMLLKILDFGISKTPVGYEDLTGTQTVIGTPSYMAPEQMKSGRAADPRSDLWSIGVVMYQLLTGRTPFTGESYAELVLKVGLDPPEPILVPLPGGLGAVVLRCLEKDPKLRFQNVGELARMLAPYASDPAAAAQAANSTVRTLEQRGAQVAIQGSPFAAGGGLAPPVPLSPAQLTPHSWAPSRGSSLSHGAGQVTVEPRGNRGLLIAGITALCLVAGVGGYVVSQASRGDGAAAQTRVRPDRHEVAPPPSPAVPAPAAAAATAPAAPAKAAPARLAEPPTAEPPTAEPPLWNPQPPVPTIVDRPVEPRPTGAEPRPTRRPSPDAKPAASKKPKSGKPKPGDGLFDSRR